MSLGGSALASVRDTGTRLLRAVRPGDRVDSPNHPADMIAPWPNVDRYPTIIGSNLTFQYLSAVQRQALFGYRLQWIDLLRELIRRDPSAYGNLTARILATAGGRIEVVSASAQFPKDERGEADRARVATIRQAAGLSPELPGMTDDERVLADQIAAHTQRQIDGIQRKPQVLAQQLWSVYFGVAGNELLWDRTPSEWRIRELHYIHPRRIAYPDQNNWHAHIWDQGLVVTSGPNWQQYLTSGLFGIDVCDYPNKFLINVPEVLSGYPTEDGLGFVLAWWIAAKLMGARNYMQFVERYAKPGVLAYYNTKHDDGMPRNAGTEDIELAKQIVQTVGFGGAPGAAIPDSVRVELFGPAAKGTASTSDPKTFALYCDDQIARAIRTTDALQGLQTHGARAALEVMAKGAKRVAFYDSMGLSATWTRDVSRAITRLNYPGLERFAPTVVLHIDDEPGPEVMLERVKDAVGVGMPLDADKTAPAVGMGHLLVGKGDTEARVLYPVKAIEEKPGAATIMPPEDDGAPAKPEETDEQPAPTGADDEEE